jgi:hypothetical protein
MNNALFMFKVNLIAAGRVLKCHFNGSLPSLFESFGCGCWAALVDIMIYHKLKINSILIINGKSDYLSASVLFTQKCLYTLSPKLARQNYS